MAAIVEISAVETAVQCDGKGNAEHKVTVHNISGRELSLGARVLLDPPAKNEWVGPIVRSDKKDKKETEWVLAENDTIQLTVPIKAKGAAEGNYSFRVEVFATEAPGEKYVTGNTLAFKVPAPKAEPQKEAKKPFPKWIIFVILGVLLLVGGGVTAWLLIGGDKVPDLTGKSLAEAEAVLQESNLKLGEVTKQVTGNNPVDTVISQTPAADTEIEEGRETVDIVLEAEPEPGVVLIPVPQLVSMSLDGAKEALKDDGLKLGTVTEETTGNYPIGTVISQNPEAKAKVEEGSVVNVVLEGPVVVPNLIKMSVDGAKLALEKVGLGVGTVKEQITGQAPIGAVINQDPKANAEVEKNSAIDITVEAHSIAVPELRTMSLQMAKSTLQKKDLIVGTVTYQRTDKHPAETVVGQDPQAEARVEEKSAVNIVLEAQPQVVYVSVPTLIGKKVNDAIAVLKEAGLGVGTVKEQITPKGVVGTVVGQTPQAKTRVQGKSEVNLITEAVSVIMPDLSGKTPAEAQQILKKVDLNLGNTAIKRTDRAKGGTIIAQSLAAGKRVPPKTAVAITVEDPYRLVASVIGQTQAQASRILASQGLKAGNITKRKTGGTPGVVLSQTPLPKSKVTTGTAVSLVVEETPKPTPKPALSMIMGRRNLSKCFHKKYGGWNNGNPIHIWDCNAGPAENKTWIYDPKTGLIRGQQNPSKCLHKKYGGWNNGNPIHVWDCNAGPAENKTWIYDPKTGLIRGRINPSKCLHKKYGGWNNGNPIHVWDCNAGPAENKTWTIRTVQ